MKITKILLGLALVCSLGNAKEVVKSSMAIMEQGMSQIQKGFLNNNTALILEGVKLVKKGNLMFSNKELIKKHLPADKKHLTNIAESQSKRISLDVTVLELNLENKSYIDAANAYSDMLNACSRCHSIVRSW